MIEVGATVRNPPRERVIPDEEGTEIGPMVAPFQSRRQGEPVIPDEEGTEIIPCPSASPTGPLVNE